MARNTSDRKNQGQYNKEQYCACCGVVLKGADYAGRFCQRCLKHAGPADLPTWDRTFFAQHGIDCPYQVK